MIRLGDDEDWNKMHLTNKSDTDYNKDTYLEIILDRSVVNPRVKMKYGGLE